MAGGVSEELFQIPKRNNGCLFSMYSSLCHIVRQSLNEALKLTRFYLILYFCPRNFLDERIHI